MFETPRLLSVKTGGVAGDGRTCGYVVGLRAATLTLHSKYMAHKRLASRPGSSRRTAGVSQNHGNGSREMRVLLPTYGSRGDVEPPVGLAVQALGAEVRVRAPPDFVELLARVGVPLMPIGVCR
jgi:hypothetical protein